ncbi:MAG: DUF1653 domain-containing protein [Lachnospiraceae bacterium]|nr:DUF1653 domain-containing protein [Lachnospiraceae bacterium]
MRPNPKPLEMYRHFKGNIYQIRCLAKHSETGEMMVVYQAMYDTFQIYVRPLDMFMEEVDRAKYPDVKQRYRFELLQDMELSLSAQEESFRQTETAEREKSVIQTEPQEDKAVHEQIKTPEHTLPESVQQEQVQTDESNEQINIDPLVMDFLDADTYEQRLNILAALRHRITDEMINTMAVAVDLEIKDGDVEERYEELKNCLLTFEKYEGNRLR